MTATATATVAALATVRDTRGRFQPGCSGNPAGKKPGTLNHATVLKRILAEGDDETIGRHIIDRALKGEWVAARFVMEHLDPKPRSRPIEFGFPEDASVSDMYEIVARAMATGEISPDEALKTARFLDALEKKREATAAAETRVQAVQAAQPAVQPAAPPTARHAAKPAAPVQRACISAPARPAVAARAAASAGKPRGAVPVRPTEPREPTLPLAAALAGAAALHSTSIAPPRAAL
jgi:hypothetical protein